jgi:transposase-like protein
MHQSDCSTVNERVHMASEMIVYEGRYRAVSEMSNRHGVSRQTLYAWKEKGKRALQGAFTPTEQSRQVEPDVELERAILTLFAEGHASDRGIQACLKELLGVQVSLGKIVEVKQEAGQRAQAWMSRQKPVEEDCAIALDEQYGG